MTWFKYMVIVHPMKARSWCTFENTKKILPCIWIIALALSSPTLYVWATEQTVYFNNVTRVTIILCADIGVDHNDRLVYATYQFLIMFLIPVIIIIFVCYIFVIHALWMSSKHLIEMMSCESGYTTVSTQDESVLSFPHTGICRPHSPCPQRQSQIRSRRSMLKRATREHSVEVLRARKQAVCFPELVCRSNAASSFTFERLKQRNKNN